MKLFYHAGTCSLSPHIVLREGGFDYTLEQVDMEHRWSDGDFYEINPKGYIPAVQLDSGEVLTEGAAIVQYLADVAPVKGLIPAVATIERARVVEWLTFIATELHKTFPTLWMPGVPEETKSEATKRLCGRLDLVARELDGKTYILGDRFSVADAYLFTVLRWSSRTNVALADWPALTAYVDRVSQRPKVREALEMEEGQ